MSITEISNLSLREKFQIMEAIWADLRGQLEAFEAPQEHRKLLNSRRERVNSGKVMLHDWDQVKHTIGRA